MARKVTVDVDVNTNADQATEEFVSLRKQIKETRLQIEALSQAGDMKGLDKAKKQLADLEDSFDKARAQSREFHDALAEMPGPAGKAGKAIQGIDGAFKALIANPIVATIAAIAGTFLALREALTRTEEGQKKLEKITNTLTKVFNGLLAVIEPIAMWFADLIIQLTESKTFMTVLSTATGVLVGAFTGLFNIIKPIAMFIKNNLINSFVTAIGVISSFGKVLKGVFTFDLDLIKQGISDGLSAVKTGVTNFVDNVKTTGKNIATGFVEGVTEGFATGEAAFKKGYSRLTDAEKEANKKKLEENKKYLEERRKQIEDSAKLEEAQLKQQMAKELSGAGDELSRIAIEEKYAKQIYDVNKKALEDIAKLYSPNSPEAKAIATSLIELNTELINKTGELNNKRKDINKKALEEYLAMIAEESAKADKAYNQAQEDRRAKQFDNIQSQIDELDRLNNARERDYEDDINRIDKKKELLNQQMAIELEALGNDEAKKLELKRRYAREITKLEKEQTELVRAEQSARFEIASAYANAIGALGSLLKDAAGENKKLAKIGLIIEQSAALASIAINAAKNFVKDGGVVSPLAWANLTAAAVQAATVVAATIKGLKNIDAQQTGKDKGGPSSPASMPAFATPSISGPSIGMATQSQTGTLAGIVNQAMQRDASRDKPIRAYVVQNDITTAQQLDRRLKSIARLG